MDTEALTVEVGRQLALAADPVKAQQMGAYMKTEMPFYGVQRKPLNVVARCATQEFPPASHAEYIEAVGALWDLPHREEKYVAVICARRWKRFITMESLDLYRRLIVEGAWWDFVDEIAAHLVGTVLANERDACTPVVRRWITSEDLWLRRTSIICQLRHKQDTDLALLEDSCVANFADRDFFIRKAIGWALRQYARTDPDWVVEFVRTHLDEMAPLSVREATKHLDAP
jgi:3-methyladenine DNA glycosylase AlkD